MTGELMKPKDDSENYGSDPDSYLSEEVNPFLSLGAGTSSETKGAIDGTDSILSLWAERTANPVVAPRFLRDWGIPTFSDQIDRGVRTFSLEREDFPSRSITLHLEHRRHSTGSDLWDSALVLAHGIARPGVLPESLPSLSGTTILELGSGTGAVGLFCAKCLDASYVIVTDLLENLDLLRDNRKVNSLEESVSICELDWTDETLPADIYRNGDGVDVIVGSDLFLPFAPHLLFHLASTLSQIMAIRDRLHSKPTVAILAYETRFDCSDFFRHADALNLHVVPIDNALLHPAYQDPGRIHALRVSLHR